MLYRLASAGILDALVRIGSRLRIGSALRLGWSALALGLAVVCQSATASSDPLIGVLSGKRDAGLDVAWRFERSPYRGGGVRYDVVPLYLYKANSSTCTRIGSA